MTDRWVIAMIVGATAVSAAQPLATLDPQPTATGVITGRVVEAGTDTPVAGATVSINQTRGEEWLVPTRFEQVTTGSAGTFVFRNLPAGEFSIAAYADGYQPGAVGKRRPESDEAWVALQRGQTFSNATIELFRGGTISGVVTNDRGEPMKEVYIETWTRTRSGQLKNGHSARTNAAGAYRITPLPAGEHFVVAHVWHDTLRQGPPNPVPSPCSPPVPPPPPGIAPQPLAVEKPKHAEGEWFSRLPRWIPEPGPDDRGRPRTIPTTIYPGVSDLSQALVVSVGGGEERTAIDLQLRPVTTTTVRGQIQPRPGQTIGKGSQARLRLPGGPADSVEHTTWVQPDNTFRFVDVPPGSYVLEVQPQESSCDVIVLTDVLTEVSLEVPPGGLDDVVVSMASTVIMEGRIRFDGKKTRPEIIDIWLRPTSGGEAEPGDWDGETQIMAGGLFPGGYALRVSQNGDEEWFVRSMTLGPLDLVTHPVAVDATDVAGVEVTMIDRPSPLDGRIVDASGNVARDATVILFPIDRTSWPTAHDHLAGFRRTRSLDGSYRFDHVVPGDYLITAVDERRMGDWPRAEFLEGIAKRASRVRILPGEPRTLVLTLQPR